MPEWMASRVYETETGCWRWTGAMSNGYGSYRRQYAHRLAFEAFCGPIPIGYEVDHLCRNRWCVNPDHLDAVTKAENVRRQNAARPMPAHGTTARYQRDCRCAECISFKRSYYRQWYRNRRTA